MVGWWDGGMVGRSDGAMMERSDGGMAGSMWNVVLRFEKLAGTVVCGTCFAHTIKQGGIRFWTQQV